MTRDALIDLVRSVLGEHAVLATISRTPHVDAVADVLLARPPERAAVIAPYDGTLHIANGRVELETKWDRALVAVEPARLIVADGARIEAGQRLTDGDVAFADTLLVFGQRAAMEQIAEALGRLLDVSHEIACEVATPMISLIEVIDRDNHRLGVRMTAPCFEAAISSLGDEPTIRGEYLFAGYDVLAAHRDPPHDLFAKQRDAEVARLAARDARIVELEARALAGDRVALQHLVLACMEPDTAPDVPGPDATMLVCREARPGTFHLQRAHDGTWRLDCLTTHSHFRTSLPIAAVVAARPAIEQFLALPPGSSVQFKDFLQIRTRRDTFPTVNSFVHRRMTHAREGALALDAECTELALRGELRDAIAAVGERMLIPSWRAQELVVAARPKFEPSSDFDRALLEIVDARGMIAAIKHYREATNAGLGDAKAYVDRLVAQRSA